jgi:hypothetical protein
MIVVLGGPDLICKSIVVQNDGMGLYPEKIGTYPALQGGAPKLLRKITYCPRHGFTV